MSFILIQCLPGATIISCFLLLILKKYNSFIGIKVFHCKTKGKFLGRDKALPYTHSHRACNDSYLHASQHLLMQHLMVARKPMTCMTIVYL